MSGIGRILSTACVGLVLAAVAEMLRPRGRSTAAGRARSSAPGTTPHAPSPSGTDPARADPGDHACRSTRRRQRGGAAIRDLRLDAPGSGRRRRAAAAAAAHRRARLLLPGNPSGAGRRLAESLAAVRDGDGGRGRRGARAAVGDVVLEARADDGFDTPDPFDPVRDPESGSRPRRRSRRCSSLSSRTWRRSRFATAPIPARPAADLASRRYARDFNEVKPWARTPALRGPRTRPSRPTSGPSLAGGWSRSETSFGAPPLGLHRTARLQALLNMAMADGFVTGWYQKRHFGFWRPVTAIRKADTDANPRTSPDPIPGCHFVRRPRCPTTPRLTASSAAPPPRSCAGSPDRTTFAFLHDVHHLGSLRAPSAAGTASRRPSPRTPACGY